MPTDLDDLRGAIRTAVTQAGRWFMTHGTLRTRNQWDARGRLDDHGQGAVYAFFGADNRAIYVGETGRTIKSRQHDETSPHKLKPWWERWTTVRFVGVPDRTDRLTLELLLILSLSPEGNEKPAGRDIGRMFET